MNTTDQIEVVKYHATRNGMVISLSIADGEVRWVYKVWGNEWRTQLPLSTLIPYPTISVSGNSLRVNFALVIGIGVAALVAMLAFSLPFWAIAICSVLLVAAMIALYLLSIKSPLEWATFDSYLPNKQIYFFCGSDRAEFELFVEKFSERIKTASDPCAD